jgi:predicted ATPase
VIDPRSIDFSSPITLASSGSSPLDATAPNYMVGRETEFSLLQQHWKQTESGKGKLIFIAGEAGVGKTRLVDELSNDLLRRGIRVLSGRCFEYERLLPYQPIAEALRTVLPTLSVRERADFPAWVLSEVSQLVPDVSVKDDNNTSYDQTRLFEGVTQFLSGLSTNRPLLVVLEDLHWASESTLQLLHYLVCHLVKNRILLIGTYRTEIIDRGHPLLEMQQQLSRDGIAKKIDLYDLSAENVESMIIKMSGDSDAAVSLARRLYQETEGNPFFLVETIKGLFETGIIHVEKGKWITDLNKIDKKI